MHVSAGPDESNENEWARLLRTITNRPDWSIARLARDSGIHRSTIFRWMKGDVQNLTLESIRLIAEAGQVDIMDALRAAATLVAPAAAERLERDYGEQAILDSDATPAQKKMMLERYNRKVAESKQAALRDLQEQIDLLGQRDAI